MRSMSCLDTVSTGRGSGWVSAQVQETLVNRAPPRRTHPLPRAVLTVSKHGFGFEVSVVVSVAGFANPTFERRSDSS
jgi:hypothetical protein